LHRRGNPFIKFKLAGSNGLYGAIIFAKTAAKIMHVKTAKDIIATGVFRK